MNEPTATDETTETERVEYRVRWGDGSEDYFDTLWEVREWVEGWAKRAPDATATIQRRTIVTVQSGWETTRLPSSDEG